MQTYAVNRHDDGEGTESLEVIDLEYEVDPANMRSHPQRTFSHANRTVGAVATISVAALLIAVTVLTHDNGAHSRHQQTGARHLPPTTEAATFPSPQTSVSIQRPHIPVLGRYYPILDHIDTTTFVLPSGRILVLSGGLRSLIGGLGATFGGSVANLTCCPDNPVTFEIFHAAPNDLFETTRMGIVSTPLLMTPAQAKVGEDGLRGSEYRFGLLSTGDWTLIGFFLSYYDLSENGLLRGWHLRSTPYGAVLNVPADSTISNEYVTLGRTPDLTDREIMLAEHGCPTGSTKAQTLGEYATHAGWCQHGLLVELFGPQSYVGVAAADLTVRVAPKV